jgi:sterol O-acyltransferase
VDIPSVRIYFICCPDRLIALSNSQWPWVQSGFLTLHTFVRISTPSIRIRPNSLPIYRAMTMKMPSDMPTNGSLHYVSQQSAAVLKQLRVATSRVDGWERAMSDAKKPREDPEREAESDRSGTETSSSSSGTRIA